MARATGDNPQYPLTLSDGVTTIGLRTPNNTAIRRLPRTVGVERKTSRQDNWNGGRANDRFETDTSKFGDSLNLWTMVAQSAISGPLFNFCTTSTQISTLKPVGSLLTYTTEFLLARSFVPAASFTIHRLYLPVPAGGVSITVKIYSSSGGAPNAQLWTGTQTSASVDTGAQSYVVFDPNLAVTASTTYWVLLQAGTAVYIDNGSYASYFDGLIWVPINLGFLFHIAEIASTGTISLVHFFEYKRGLYGVVKYAAASSVSALLINGDRGMATGTQTTSTLKDTTKTWTVNEWAGCVAYIFSGTNAGEYRTIASNTADTLTLSSVWAEACTAGTGGSVYVILGSDKWTAIGSTGFPAACTGVAVLNNIVYFAFGDAQNMQRMQEVDSTGTWTRSFAADGTNKATHLLAAADYSTSDLAMYKANNDTSTVAMAPKVAWGTSFTFATAIECGGLESRINSMVFYDSAVHALKDDSVWKLSSSGKFGKVDITLDTARDERNGVAAQPFNKNLYFSFMDGVQRLYGTVVDDIGPNRDEGMPVNRRGAITALRPVVQYLIGAYDAGASGYSSVLVTGSPGGDWHEIFRAMESGQRIRSIFYQTVPGRANKLWIMYGDLLAYLIMPDDTHSPLNDANMRYAPKSSLTTAWFDFDTAELSHFFQYLRVLARNVGSFTSMDLYYQTEANETTWTSSGQVTESGVIKQVTIGAGSVTGSKIRFRLVFNCNTVTPIVLKSYELRANQINESLYDVIIDLEFADWVMMMGGGDSRDKVTTVINALETWKASPVPLTVRCAIPELSGLLDNVRCNIDPFSILTMEWTPDTVTLSGNLQLKIV